MQENSLVQESLSPETIDLLENDVIAPEGSKVNILIKKFANAMKDAGIPNCIMAWDDQNTRYVFAGAMPEEIGDGTKFSSRKLTRFVRFLELCTDFDKNNYKFNL